MTEDNQSTLDNILTTLEEVRILLEKLVRFEHDRYQRDSDVLRK